MFINTNKGPTGHFTVLQKCSLKGTATLTITTFYMKGLKSHYLRASDSLNYGLEIEKIDFLEILPIFNFCQEMNKNAHFSQFFTSVSMATTIFYF